MEYRDSYFGVEWNQEQSDKPWRDTDFLQRVYESDAAPTYQEIADELECSVNTIANWMPDDAQRGGPGLPYEDIAMFSGGYDSLVSTYYTMEEIGADVVLHIDTLTGIPENKDFVKKVCDVFGWDLEIITPNMELEEFAKKYGFPKPPAHSWIYRYLKEHPLSSFTTSLECDKPTYYTGVRKDESARRMENVSSETQEDWNGRWFWEAPIADWSDEDVYEYIIEKGLPRNPVVETIDRSGECFCGAYADRFSELLTLKENYPEHYEWVKEVERRVQEEIGTDEDISFWGGGGVSDEQLKILQEEDEPDEMMLCVDCEDGGHRSFGHNKNPTYESIYVASKNNDIYDFVKQYDKTVEWINPYDLNEYDDEQKAVESYTEVYGKDTDAMRQSDGLLLNYTDDDLCGVFIEAAVATESVGIPVVVYNDTDDDIPLMLQGLAVDVHDDRVSAIQSVLKHARTLLDRSSDRPVMV